MEKRPRYIPEEEAKTPNEDAEQGAVADSGVSSTTSPESLKPRRRNSKRWYSRLGKNLLELLPVEIEIRRKNSNVSILEPSQPQESRDHTEQERHETMATVSNDVSDTSPMLIERADSATPIEGASGVGREYMDETEMIEEGSEMDTHEAPTVQETQEKELLDIKSLAEDENLHTLEYEVELDPELEVPVNIKIPEELWSIFTSLPVGFRDVPDYYSRQIDAYERFNSYLNDVWYSLDEDNVIYVAMEQSEKTGNLLKRARRAVTRIQFENMDRIEGFKDLRKRVLWGQDCLYTIVTPFAS